MHGGAGRAEDPIVEDWRALRSPESSGGMSEPPPDCALAVPFRLSPDPAAAHIMLSDSLTGQRGHCASGKVLRAGAERREKVGSYGIPCGWQAPTAAWAGHGRSWHCLCLPA